MIFASVFLLFASFFAETKTFALQIHLDKLGYSCSAIDGVWGEKSERALSAYLKDYGLPTASPDAVYDRDFANKEEPFEIVVVTAADLAACRAIPDSPAERAKLTRMGYESAREMFAERGHVSQKALVRLNPGVDWDHLIPGQKLVIPRFPSIAEELRAGNRGMPNRPSRPEAALVRVSLSRNEISVYAADGKRLALFPCSIAANKAKVPPHGELKITNYIAWPNYTYTPDYTPPGKKVQRYIWPEGENCPVGVAWMGLNLPGYGIHGTPVPESIGFTGSHGCFRLANWNAARLYAMTRSGTRVLIEP